MHAGGDGGTWPHTPALQYGLFSGQTLPQLPQFFASVWRLASQPSPVLLLQLA